MILFCLNFYNERVSDVIICVIFSIQEDYKKIMLVQPQHPATDRVNLQRGAILTIHPDTTKDKKRVHLCRKIKKGLAHKPQKTHLLQIPEAKSYESLRTPTRVSNIPTGKLKRHIRDMLKKDPSITLPKGAIPRSQAL